MREQRKVVTVIFADVVGSTSFAAENDPEVVRSRMSRYFRRVSEIAEAYGGTVEKFAGDSAMVVFGVPVVHDDDAERAVRAALEIRDGASDLPVRVGVNTGEAVAAATEDRQFMVSGDAVNVAARLQQGAEPGDVLVGDLTHRLTRNAIEYEQREPVMAKGKSGGLTAYRAVRPKTVVPTQARGVAGLHSPLVGRKRELRLLLDTFARAREDMRPHLFTLVGSAGVGKSRLVGEALDSVASSGARVLRGRCLPYGRGVTYWPLIEMLQQDAAISVSDERTTALDKLDRCLGGLLTADPQLPAVRARLSVMLGLEPPQAVMPDTAPDEVGKEIAWAMRRYLEAAARAEPLIVVVDDIQWADPQIIALFGQLPERVGDVPMLVICIARPEFLESRRDWSSGQSNSTTITLDPLSPGETSALISHLLEIDGLPTHLRDQIVERSAGTPLFCEEFIQMLIDEGRVVRAGAGWQTADSIQEIQVPQSISAVLASRLDGLPEFEKQLLQAASVIGERFELGQVQSLTAGDGIEPALDSLRRKGLVAFGDEPADLHFRHLLIRDAAYTSLPKSERARLHDRFGTVLESEAGDPQKLAEILAHHAERAFILSTEVDLDREAITPRALRALRWSVATADRARQRHDIRTADAALQTARAAAASLPDGGPIELRARTELLEAQTMEMKADYAGAHRAAAEAARLAELGRLPQLVAKARLIDAWIAHWTHEGGDEDFRQTIELAIEACRAAGDVSGEIEARRIGTYMAYATGMLSEFVETNERLLEQARAIGAMAQVAAIEDRLVSTEHLRGNLEAAQRHLAEAERLAAQHGLRSLAIDLMRPKGTIPLLAGDFATAVPAFRAYVAAAEEAGAVQDQVSALRFLAYAFMYSDSYDQAAGVLDRAVALSEASGESWNRAEVRCLRARCAMELGDPASAEAFIQSALELLREFDVTGTSEVFNQLGVIRAAAGRDKEAEAALRKALEVVAPTEYLWVRSIAALDLARFLATRGRPAEAAPLVEEYAAITSRAGWHAWDRQIAEIRRLIPQRT